MRFRLLITVAVLAILGLCAERIQADSYIITLDPAARSEPATGRVILFFITKEGRRWERTDPMEGPHFDAPQPIASIAVKDFKPGESVTIRGDAPAFPQPLNHLDGRVRVQAILDADQTERSHDAGPGNVYSVPMTVTVSSAQDDTIRITLTERVEPQPREDGENLKFITFRSEMLSEFYGRDVYHRAGMALPRHYHNAEWSRQGWPAVYVIPGFGGRDDGAAEYAAMLHAPKVEEIAPNAVFIVLDPEAPLGHHTFADSANNGPRGAALGKEFIPYLESQFRLVRSREARIVTGHSSGGWASLWLQLNYPEVFGACWASAPDPIDFSAFQMTDLYNDVNMFQDKDGNPTPSYRRILDSTLEPKVAMTVQQEVAMEHAIDPDGRSGQQWDAWTAVFSPRDEATKLPARLFDPESGEIHKSIVQHWEKYDITRMVERRWNELGPVVLNNVRLVCGDQDSYYLNRAVERFAAMIERLRGDEPAGDGYVLIVPNANHDTVISKTFMRWNEEMRSYLQKRSLQDADVPEKE